MMRAFIYLLVMVGSICQVCAQSEMDSTELAAQKEFSYYFTIRSGAATGCKVCAAGNHLALSVSTIHGFTIGDRWRLGAGIGLDSYEDWQTIPVFGSLSFDLFKLNDSRFYTQMVYGYSKALRNYEYSTENFKDGKWGLMVNPEMGYRVKRDNMSVSFFMGYKFQKISASYMYPYYHYNIDGTFFPDGGSTTRISMELNRLTLGIGVGWK